MTEPTNRQEKDGIIDKIAKDDKGLGLVIYFTITYYMFKNNKHFRNIILLSLLFVSLALLALVITINIVFLEDSSAKLAIFAGIGWFISYCMSKSNELKQRDLEVKQQKYEELISALNKGDKDIFALLNKTLLYTNDNIGEIIKEYLNSNLPNSQEQQLELSNVLLVKMKDELFTIRNSIGGLGYIIYILGKDNPKKEPNNQRIQKDE